MADEGVNLPHVVFGPIQMFDDAGLNEWIDGKFDIEKLEIRLDDD